MSKFDWRLQRSFGRQLHAELADAIGAGRPGEAANASERLIDYIEDLTRASLEASV